MDRMEIGIDNLILEVTRRCNMHCAHCLRGDAQNLDISKKTIKQLIDSVSYIGTVTFSGGEPTLNLPAIQYFFEYAEKQGKLPYSFYVVTNGKENQEELALLLLKWYGKMEEKDIWGVAQSVDIYHDSESDPEESILRGLSFYRSDKEHSGYYKLIAEGRSEDDPDARPLADWELNVPEPEDGRFEQLYVAANGNLFYSCDASFDHVDEDAVYKVSDLPMLAAIEAA